MKTSVMTKTPASVSKNVDIPSPRKIVSLPANEADANEPVTYDDRIKLGLIDQGFMGSPPVMVILYYEMDLDPQRVYQAVRDALGQFPQISGRIVEDEDKTLWFEHMPYHFAFNANERPDLDAESLLMQENLMFEDLTGLIDDSVTKLGEALLGVHITRLKTGTLLTLAASHAAADAESGRLFTTALMASLLGAPMPAPSLQRSFGFQRQGERRGQRIEHYADHPLRRAGAPRPGGVRSVRVSGDTVKRHLESLEGTSCTTHDVIAAMVIKEYADWFLPDNPQVLVRIPINLRPLLDNIDPNYVGNAVVDCALTWSKEELADLDLYDIAVKVREALIQTKDAKYLNDRIRLDQNGVNYDAFIGEGTQGFDPQNDLIISSVGNMQARLGGPGMPKVMFTVPAVLLCSMVHKVGDDFLLQLFQPTLKRNA